MGAYRAFEKIGRKLRELYAGSASYAEHIRKGLTDVEANMLMNPRDERSLRP